MASFYSSTVDAKTKRQVMKSIIAFYTKAKAHLQLSDFYDACAQVRWKILRAASTIPKAIMAVVIEDQQEQAGACGRQFRGATYRKRTASMTT